MNQTHPDVAHNLAMAIIACSTAPALLLDGDLNVVAASTSFCSAFSLDDHDVAGRPLFVLGHGEWNVPQLRSLLEASLGDSDWIDGYEMELRGAAAPRRLVLDVKKLDYGEIEHVRLLLTVSDVTEARIAEKLRDDLLREKTILLQEIQHRVANSLQIIASVLMMSARRVQSAETRSHLHDAHHRVLSMATLQRQLAASKQGDVELRGYFTQLCESLGASMIHDHARLALTVSADDSRVNADISVSLGLIVTELVINALKHAFPGDRSGKIRVDYRADGQDWKLSISDDGVGTAEMMAGATPGLGTSIVDALANQLRATVETEDGQPGTTVSIVHQELSTPERAKRRSPPLAV